MAGHKWEFGLIQPKKGEEGDLRPLATAQSTPGECKVLLSLLSVPIIYQLLFIEAWLLHSVPLKFFRSFLKLPGIPERVFPMKMLFIQINPTTSKSANPGELGCRFHQLKPL